MTEIDERPVIETDEPLQEYGIFTEETADLAEGALLSREDFRQAQIELFDVHPRDTIFLQTAVSAIELQVGLRMRNTSPWAKDDDNKTVDYIHHRRPSQPDWLIDARVADRVLRDCRYAINELTGYRSLNRSRYPFGEDDDSKKAKIEVLQHVIAAKGITDTMTMEEFEMPVRLSGETFMSPRWTKDVIAADPRLLTVEDFCKYDRRQDKERAVKVFSSLGQLLLDESQAATKRRHDCARSCLRYIWNRGYGDPGVLSIGTLAAQEALLTTAPEDFAFEIDKRAFEIGQKTVNSAIAAMPESWWVDGRLVPPRHEGEFDF
jgi:hypothetical protein